MSCPPSKPLFDVNKMARFVNDNNDDGNDDSTQADKRLIINQQDEELATSLKFKQQELYKLFEATVQKKYISRIKTGSNNDNY